jgi:hypothetical protein
MTCIWTLLAVNRQGGGVVCVISVLVSMIHSTLYFLSPSRTAPYRWACLHRGKALWYMRTCLNAYFRAAGLIPGTFHPRVRPLPVYGATPFPPIPAAF